MPPTDPGDDELTAYLDGELDGAAARAVEAKLANDLTARRQAEGLKKAFDLLDYLPKAEPSPDFATRTITRLQPAVVVPPAAAEPAVAATPTTPSASAVAPLVVPQSARRWPHAAAVAWLAAGVVALGHGYAGHRLAPASGAAEDQANDYRVLAHLPLYLGVEDFDYVKALDATELFGAEYAAPPRAGTDGDAAPTERLSELFRGYPVARRQQLRKLDGDLHDLPAAEQDRLRPVLENYALWLDRLPDAERRELLATPTPAARLEAVTQLYQRQWRDDLPQPQRAKLAATVSATEKAELVGAWKAAEKARRDEWHVARRQWPTLFGRDRQAPWPFSEPGFAKQVDDYVKAVFKVDLALPLPKIDGKSELPGGARLNRAEFVYLKSAHDSATKEGNWFVYGVAVHRLSQQHPYLPEPLPGRPVVTTVATLPADLPPRFKLPPKSFDTATRGKWPDFALEVARKCVAERLPVPESLGPCRPADFAEPVRDFVTKVLVPRLTEAERDGLKKLEGKWPEYPQLVLSLAKLPKYDFAVPTVTLPGAPSLWAKYYGFAPAKE